MADQVETLISEAERVIEQLGENKTKDLSELKAELDAMIAASKQPGYSPDDERVQVKKRELVIAAMETALHTLMGEGLETIRSAPASTEQVETPPTQTETTTPTTTQSAFVPESTTPAPATQAPGEAPKKWWQTFIGNAGGILSSIGTYFSNLWNSWFGKKEETPAPEVKQETPATAAPTTPETTTPATPAPTTEVAPNPAAQRAYDEDPTAPDPGTGSDEAIPSPSDTRPETSAPAPNDPSLDPLTPEAPAEALPAAETVNLMDGLPHNVGGHQLLWTGSGDNLFSIDGRKFGVDLVTMAGIGVASPKIEKVGDNVIIRTTIGDKELNPAQIDSLVNQALNTPPLTKPAVMLFGKELQAAYQYIPIRIEYSSLSGAGATQLRTPDFKELELRPQS